MTTTLACAPGALDTEQVQADLARDGYALTGRVGGQRFAIELLQALGRLMPQNSGSIEHEVAHRPGFEGRSYSQSANTILAHTEAPGWNPSPRYVALYCHRQARCGGGHTDLLDAECLTGFLDGRELRLLTHQPIEFPAPRLGAGVQRGVRAPLLARDGDKPVLRFSYNLLAKGEYDPPLSACPEPEELPLGAVGARLADRISELFAEHRTPLLIPDDALLVWDNHRMLHARSEYADKDRHLTRYWIAPSPSPGR